MPQSEVACCGGQVSMRTVHLGLHGGRGSLGKSREIMSKLASDGFGEEGMSAFDLYRGSADRRNGQQLSCLATISTLVAPRRDLTHPDRYIIEMCSCQWEGKSWMVHWSGRSQDPRSSLELMD